MDPGYVVVVECHRPVCYRVDTQTHAKTFYVRAQCPHCSMHGVWQPTPGLPYDHSPLFCNCNKMFVLLTKPTEWQKTIDGSGPSITYGPNCYITWHNKEPVCVNDARARSLGAPYHALTAEQQMGILPLTPPTVFRHISSTNVAVGKYVSKRGNRVVTWRQTRENTDSLSMTR